MKACPNCHSKYPDDANFCPQETCATPDGPRRLVPVPAEPAPRFQLTSKLGGARSGEVWVARDTQTGNDVAYKLVTPEVLPTPAAFERAQRELKQLQRAQNPHLAVIVDFGRGGDGRLFVASEVVSGQTLGDLVRNAGPLPVDRAKKLVAQIGEALLEGQKVGVVHHDLAAKNVFVGANDDVKLINFVTPWPVTEAVFGVPEYLSPEQAEGKLVDQRSNTYSLGALFMLMLTGQPPVSGADDATILAQVREGVVTPPSQLRQGLTPEIDRVVLKAMEKNSSRRPLTMRQFLAEVAGVVGLPAAAAAAPAKAAAFAKTMMFAGGSPDVQNLVKEAVAAREAANGSAPAAARAPTPAPVPQAATQAVTDVAAAQRRTHGAAIAATMVALPSAAPGPMPGAALAPSLEAKPAFAAAPAMQMAANGPGGGGGAGGGGGGAGGGGSGSGGGSGGQGFRETLWFKKGDVEQMVAEAKAKAAAAAAKGKPVVAAEELPIEDAKPLEDRYVDDGTVTVEDRKKFSLRSGGTAAGLPAVGVIPGERMSDNEMISEIGSGKKMVIIGVAVAVVAIIVAVLVMSHKKSAPAAAAEAPAAATAAAAPPPAPAAAPRARRARGGARRSGGAGPRRGGDRRWPRRRPPPRWRRPSPRTSTPRSPRARRARRRSPARSTTERHRGKPSTPAKPSRASRACDRIADGRPTGDGERRRPSGEPREEAVHRRRDGAGDLLDGAAAVVDDGRGVGGCEAAVVVGDARLNGVVVVALDDAARGPAPRRRDLDRHVEQDREIGGAQPAREPRHPAAIRFLRLIGQRRHQVPVGHDVRPRGDVRLDLAAQVIAPVGGEEQRHGLPVGGRPVGERVLPEQQLAQEPADRARRGLTRGVRAAAAALEVSDEPIELRRRARAVDPFESDEDGASGGHLLVPKVRRAE